MKTNVKTIVKFLCLLVLSTALLTTFLSFAKLKNNASAAVGAGEFGVTITPDKTTLEGTAGEELKLTVRYFNNTGNKIYNSSGVIMYDTNVFELTKSDVVKSNDVASVMLADVVCPNNAAASLSNGYIFLNLSTAGDLSDALGISATEFDLCTITLRVKSGAPSGSTTFNPATESGYRFFIGNSTVPMSKYADSVNLPLSVEIGDGGGSGETPEPGGETPDPGGETPGVTEPIAGEFHVTISSDITNFNINSTNRLITFTIHYANGTGSSVYNSTGAFKFDPNVFEYHSIELSSEVAEIFLTSINILDNSLSPTSGGYALLNLATAGNNLASLGIAYPSFNVGTITLKVKDNAPVGQTQLTMPSESGFRYFIGNSDDGVSKYCDSVNLPYTININDDSSSLSSDCVLEELTYPDSVVYTESDRTQSVTVSTGTNELSVTNLVAGSVKSADSSITFARETSPGVFGAEQVNGTILLVAPGNTTKIRIYVYAQDGTKSEPYYLDVVREAADPNNTLDTSLIAVKNDSNTLSGTWSGQTYVITDEIPFEDVGNITIAVLLDSVSQKATLKIDGASALSGIPKSLTNSYPLSSGTNTIPIEVRAEDGSINNYYVEIEVAPQKSTDVSATITYDGLTLVKSGSTFSKNLAYSESPSIDQINFLNMNITVSPTATILGCYLGTRTTSDYVSATEFTTTNSQPLVAGGSVTITVIVQAEAGNKWAYLMTISRANPSTNSTLTNLVYDGIPLTKSGSVWSGSITYNQSKGAFDEILSSKISSTLPSGATVEYLYNDGTFTNIPWSSGYGADTIAITVRVTSEAGGSNYTDYTLEISRSAASNDATLKSLAISPYTYLEAFNPSTDTYTVTIPYGVALPVSLVVTPTVHADATYSITSQEIDVLPKSIIITVTAQDETEKNYTINVVRETSYEITVTNGTHSGNPTAGSTITLTLDPLFLQTGEQLDYWTVNGSTISGNTFIMPASDVTAEPTKKMINYIVRVNNGSYSGTPNYLEEISLTPSTAPTGQTFKEWSIVSGSITISDNKFIMPASNVEVTAIFERITYTITVTDGSYTGTPQYNERIELGAYTGSCDTGKEFDKWTSADVTIASDSSFTMPAKHVTVTPTFKNTVYAVTVVGGSYTGSPVYNGTINLVLGTVPEGKSFDYWDTTVTLTGNSFTMPASDVTVTAIYKDEKYLITEITNGTADKSSDLLFKEKVTLTLADGLNPAEYLWEVRRDDTNAIISVTWKSTNVFEMPSCDIKISAEYIYSGAYTITVTGGSADKSMAFDGDSVTLTADAPASGYRFKEWNVISGGATISGNTFTMPASNVVIEAVFEEITYTVTVTNGTHSGTTQVGNTISLTPSTLTGKQFKEWRVVSGGVTISGNSFVMPANNVEIEAIFESTNYTVTVTNGTYSGTPQYGNTISLTADAPTSGYRFKEWNVISGGVTITGNTFTMPANNVVVEAVFEEITYTVTVTNGTHTGTTQVGNTISLTPSTLTGKQFKEWRVISGGVTIANDEFTMPANNVEIEAIFESTNYTVTVTNGTYSGTPQYGNTISLTADAPASGYRFKEWNVISGGATISGNTFTMPASNVVVEAVFEKITYIVTVTNGTYSGTTQVGNTISLTPSTLTGKQFKEWRVVSGDVTISGNSFVMPANNVEIEAIFESTNYTVTVTNGTYSGTPQYGNTISLTADTPASGYRFKEWNVISGGVTITGNTFTMPANNVVVEAVFEEITYTVTVTNGTHTGTTQVGNTISLTPSTLTGKQFKEWRVISGGVTIANDEFTMPANNVEIEAVFENNTYTVTVTNGTYGGTPQYGNTISLTADTPASGYRFKEWNVISGGVTITGNTFTMPANNVVVEAVYEPIISPTLYTISVTGGVANKTSAEAGETITLVVNSADIPVGKQFDAWVVNGVSITGSTFTMPAQNVVAVATYKDMTSTYTIMFVVDGFNMKTANAFSGDSVWNLRPQPDPSKSGYTFSHWISGSAVLNSSVIVTGNQIWTAVFTEITAPVTNAYTIKFYIDEVLLFSFKSPYGSTISMSFPNGYFKEGYKFIGWEDMDAGIIYRTEYYMVNDLVVQGRDYRFRAVYSPLENTGGTGNITGGESANEMQITLFVIAGLAIIIALLLLLLKRRKDEDKPPKKPSDKEKIAELEEQLRAITDELTENAEEIEEYMPIQVPRTFKAQTRTTSLRPRQTSFSKSVNPRRTSVSKSAAKKPSSSVVRSSATSKRPSNISKKTSNAHGNKSSTSKKPRP